MLLRVNAAAAVSVAVNDNRIIIYLRWDPMRALQCLLAIIFDLQVALS